MIFRQQYTCFSQTLEANEVENIRVLLEVNSSQPIV